MSYILEHIQPPDSDQDWMIWERGVSVIRLPSIDDSMCSDDACRTSPENTTPQITINRPQYSAIISRMNQAARHTGAFSSW